MRKGFSLTAVASAMVLATGSAFALGQGAGFGFEQWGASSGTVTHACEAGSGKGITGYTCSTIADGLGFKQLMVTNDSTGETFIGTLVTDQAATGSAGDATNRLGFADESYVKMVFNTGGGASQQTENGISAKQTLYEFNQSDKTEFTSTTEIETASVTAKPISINQALKSTGNDAASAGDDFMSSFIYEASIDSTTGARTGFQMQLDQIAGLAANGGSAGDVQNFSLRERAGSMLTVAGGGTGTITMQGAVDPNTKDASGNPVPNTSLTYASNDDIKMVWLGQNVDLSSVTAGTTPSTQMGSLFGYLSFENKGAFGSTTATPEVMARFSLLDVSSGTNTAAGGDAWAWDPQFGIKFGDPTGTQAPSGAPVMNATTNDPSGGLVTF